MCPSLTKLQQGLSAEELKLEKSLARIYRNIKRDLDIKLTSGFVQWADIQRIYRPMAEDAIRSSVTEMYNLAAKKTVERDIKVPYFLTAKDMDEIASLTRKYQDWFFVGLDRELVKKTSMAFDPQTFMRIKPDYNLVSNLKDTFIARMTESLHGEVAARAVLSKARQLIPIGGKSKARFAYYANRSASSLYKSAAVGTGEVISGPHLVWQTAEDERVCEICAPLDGNEYAVDDPAVDQPVIDTHPRCRCELVLVDSELSGRSELYPFEGIDEFIALEEELF